MFQSPESKLKQYLNKQAAPAPPRGDGSSPAAEMLHAFLKDLQQQRRPPNQVRRNQATETRGDVPGPRLASMLRGLQPPGGGGDRGRRSEAEVVAAVAAAVQASLGAAATKPPAQTKASATSAGSTSGSATISPRAPETPRVALTPRSSRLPETGSQSWTPTTTRRIREPSQRLLTLAQPRRQVEAPRTPWRHAPPPPPPDKRIVAMQRVRTRQAMAEAAHCQRAASEHGSEISPRQISSSMQPIGTSGASVTGADKGRGSFVGTMPGVTSSTAPGDFTISPRVALTPRRSVVPKGSSTKGWTSLTRRRVREPSERILQLAQPRKMPQQPEGVTASKRRKTVVEATPQPQSAEDKAAAMAERVRSRQVAALEAHIKRAPERAKLASRWRHTKEDQNMEAATAPSPWRGRPGSLRQTAVPATGSVGKW